MRTRVRGAVGAGGEKPPATRLAAQSHLHSQKLVRLLLDVPWQLPQLQLATLPLFVSVASQLPVQEFTCVPSVQDFDTQEHEEVPAGFRA